MENLKINEIEFSKNVLIKHLNSEKIIFYLNISKLLIKSILNEKVRIPCQPDKGWPD